MNIAGIDYSTHAIDIVQIPLENNTPPRWDRFDLEGDLAFDRAALTGDSKTITNDELRGHVKGGAMRSKSPAPGQDAALTEDST